MCSSDLIPVTTVPLVAAALQTFDADFVTRTELLDRISEIRESLRHRDRQLVECDGNPGEVLERAYPDLEFLWLETEDSSGEVFWLYARQLR